MARRAASKRPRETAQHAHVAVVPDGGAEQEREPRGLAKQTRQEKPGQGQEQEQQLVPAAVTRGLGASDIPAVVTAAPSSVPGCDAVGRVLVSELGTDGSAALTSVRSKEGDGDAVPLAGDASPAKGGPVPPSVPPLAGDALPARGAEAEGGPARAQGGAYSVRDTFLQWKNPCFGGGSATAQQPLARSALTAHGASAANHRLQARKRAAADGSARLMVGDSVCAPGHGMSLRREMLAQLQARHVPAHSRERA